MVKVNWDGKEWELNDAVAHVKKLFLSPGSRILNTLELVEGNKILDFGCGVGITSALIAKKNHNSKVIGIDINPDAIKIAKNTFNLPNLSFEVIPKGKISINKKDFDCVLFLEVIEHVPNPVAFLDTFKSQLNKKGVLVISTPNAVSLFSIVRQIFRGKKRLKAISSESRNTGTHLDHIYSWDIFTLCRLLDRSGFKYVTHRYAESTPLNFMGPLLGRFRSTIILKVQKK
ncbi:MAG: class I SAM-dependent methyltransferase [Candidatus ainarchaeum sp.]|nr:class I SAM-dependent methyltransferase [Candidatus ainarchaeum sp.]